MILEKNKLANSPRVNQILHRVDILICTPKKQQSSSITFKSHKLALDHSRLSLENKFLENKSGPIVCVRQVSEVCFTRSC